MKCTCKTTQIFLAHMMINRWMMTVSDKLNSSYKKKKLRSSTSHSYNLFNNLCVRCTPTRQLQCHSRNTSHTQTHTKYTECRSTIFSCTNLQFLLSKMDIQQSRFFLHGQSLHPLFYVISPTQLSISIPNPDLFSLAAFVQYGRVIRVNLKYRRCRANT